MSLLDTSREEIHFTFVVSSQPQIGEFVIYWAVVAVYCLVQLSLANIV